MLSKFQDLISTCLSKLLPIWFHLTILMLHSGHKAIRPSFPYMATLLVSKTCSRVLKIVDVV